MNEKYQFLFIAFIMVFSAYIYCMDYKISNKLSVSREEVRHMKYKNTCYNSKSDLKNKFKIYS